MKKKIKIKVDRDINQTTLSLFAGISTKLRDESRDLPESQPRRSRGLVNGSLRVPVHISSHSKAGQYIVGD